MNTAIQTAAWTSQNTSIEMWLTATQVAPVAQKVGRELREICTSAGYGLGAVQFGFVPMDAKVYCGQAGTDWHVLPLRELLSYQLFGVLEVPDEQFHRIQTLNYRGASFDELYIAVETKRDEPLSLMHTTAPAIRGHYSYPTQLSGYEFVHTMDEASSRLRQLDPILFGVKFIGRMSRGVERLVGMMELARWNW